MVNRDPNIVTSSLSGLVTQDGVTVEVNIIRLEDELGWSLEVVNDRGTSTTWDDQFASDEKAFSEFQRTVAREGIQAFLDHAKIIPFPRP